MKLNEALLIGVLWDSKEQLLHWVDIDTAEIHT